MTIMHMRSNNYYSQKMDDSSSAGKVDAKDFQLPYGQFDPKLAIITI